MNHKLERVRDTLLQYLTSKGYSPLASPSINNSSTDSSPFKFDYDELLLAIGRLNPHNNNEQLKQLVIDKLEHLSRLPLLAANKELHDMLRNGVRCFYGEKGTEVGENIKIFDMHNSANNNLSFCYDFGSKALLGCCDILLLVNGLPLVLVRIVNDNPLDNATNIQEILLHYQDYPALLYQNSMILITDGTEVAIGAQFTQNDKLSVWRGLEGKHKNKQEDDKLAISLLDPDTLLDFIANFISFSRAPHQLDGMPTANGSKILATYYQYYGVNQLISARPQSASQRQQSSTNKLGVIGHAYGSRVNHAMLFYIGKLLRELSKSQPTLLCVLENIDVEDRFLQFAMDNSNLLGVNPVRAESAGHLRELINLAGGGVIIASVQKFYADSQDTKKVLSNGDNIFVLLKGANVCNYGTGGPYVPSVKNKPAKSTKIKKLKDEGFGEKFLPNAQIAGFINITNTDLDDKVFKSCGDYVSHYSIADALRDDRISNTYYDKRLIDYDASIRQSSKGASKARRSNKSEKGLDKILFAPKRIKLIAEDLVTHFVASHAIHGGKGLIAVTNRELAALLYDEIISLQPQWESPDLSKGTIKVLMTSDANDPPAWNKHRTSQQERKILRLRYRNPKDPLNLVIVRDMWLAEFNEESMHTIYWAKFMQEYGIIQELAVSNAMRGTKFHGLILDYIGIEKHLLAANEDYINKEGKSMIIIDAKEGVRTMGNKMAKINKQLNFIDYSSYIKSSKKDKHAIINATREHIFDKDMLPRQLIKMIEDLAKIYNTLHFKQEMLEYEPGLLFLYGLRDCLLNLEPKVLDDNKLGNSHLIDKSISVLDNKYLYGIEDIHNPKYVNIEQKIISHTMLIKNHKVRDRALSCLVHKWVERIMARDVLLGRRFLDKLHDCAIDYSVRLTPSKVKKYRESLNALAAAILEHSELRQKLGVNEDVYSIYNLLSEFQDKDQALTNKRIIGLSEDMLKEMLVNRGEDWHLLEHARASLRVKFKHRMREYAYITKAEAALVNHLLTQAVKILSTKKQ